MRHQPLALTLRPALRLAGRRVHVWLTHGAVALLIAAPGCGGDPGAVLVLDGPPAPSADEPPASHQEPPSLQSPVPPATGPAELRRLSANEYLNTVSDLLGVETPALRKLVPSDSTSSSFRNGSDALPSAERTFAYEAAAGAVAVAASFEDVLLPLAPCSDLYTRCTLGFVHEFGQLLYRRPLTPVEARRLSGLFDVAEAEGDGFEQGARLVVQAMLQSPHFLYRLERAAPASREPARAQVDHYELASRLSFLLWQAGPDTWLLSKAERQELSESNLRAVVRQMLDDPRARRGVRGFIEEWLGIYRLDERGSDDDGFGPSRQLFAEMKEETLSFFEKLIFDERADVMQAFLRQETSVSDDLAELYGLNPLGEGTHTRDLSQVSGRRGFLTQPAVIAANTPTGAPSIVDRGLFVSRTLLCQDIPPPPANVATDLEDIPEDLPERERLARHTSDPACGACHQVFDPYGHALQRYDAMGKLRKLDEHGHPIPPGGVMLLDGVQRSYRNIHEFLALLADSPGIERCLVEKVVEYAFGRALESTDQATLAALLEQFSESRHDAQDLFAAVAMSPSYRLRSMAERSEDP